MMKFTMYPKKSREDVNDGIRPSITFTNGYCRASKYNDIAKISLSGGEKVTAIRRTVNVT